MPSNLASASACAVEAVDDRSYRLIDHGHHATAVIVPSLGNNCVRYRASPRWRPDLEALDVVLPPSSLAELADVPFCGGVPLLFPFPNRIRDGEFAFGGRTYRFARLQRLSKRWDACAGQAIHGLVDQVPWRVTRYSADDAGAALTCSLDLEQEESVREQFPFAAHLEVTHRLARGTLVIDFTVENRDGCPMPMGFGIHPWFPAAFHAGMRLPQDLARIGKERRRRTRVRLPCPERWELRTCMPTGERRSVQEDPARWDLRAGRALDDREYDDIWSMAPAIPSGGGTASIIDGDGVLRIDVAADADFREWVLYAPGDRPVAVVEPYTCVTDAPNLAHRGIDTGLIALAPGQRWRGRIAIAPSLASDPPLEIPSLP